MYRRYDSKDFSNFRDPRNRNQRAKSEDKLDVTPTPELFAKSIRNIDLDEQETHFLLIGDDFLYLQYLQSRFREHGKE